MEDTRANADPVAFIKRVTLAAEMAKLNSRWEPAQRKRARKRFIRGHYFVTQAAFDAMVAGGALPRGFTI